MIYEDFDDTNNTRVLYPDLTKEESFFLELLIKKEHPVINIRYTSEGLIINNLESFLSFYSEHEIIGLLEDLASKKIMEKKEKGGILLCPKCGHHTSMLIFSCPRCRSTHVGFKEDLYHEQCGYIGSRAAFLQGVLLRCPRCDVILEEGALQGEEGFYSISDSYFECQDCGTRVSKKDFHLICVKCNTKYERTVGSYLFSTSYQLSSDFQKESTISQRNVKNSLIPESVRSQENIHEKRIDDDDLSRVEDEERDRIESRYNDEKFMDTPIPPEKKELFTGTKKSKPLKKEDRLSLKEKLVMEYDSGVNIIPSYRWWEKTEPGDKEILVNEPGSDIENIPKQDISQIMDNVDPMGLTTNTKSNIDVKTTQDIEFTDDKISVEEYNILLIIENNTIADFIIENLENIKKPIRVIYADEEKTAIEHLNDQYDAIILDLDLKNVEEKILSALEKASIITPILTLSYDIYEGKENGLNIKAFLRKKQDDYNKINSILEDIFSK